MTYGLTSAGFVAKPYTTSKAEIEAVFRAAFGNTIPLHAQSAFGQIARILADRENTLWQLAEAVAAALDPYSATGAALDAVCAITGTIRKAATSTRVRLFLGGNGTVIPAGSQVSRANSAIVFETVEDSGYADGEVDAEPWSTSTHYDEGDLVSNGGGLFLCLIGGTSADEGTGPTGTGTAIGDNGVFWRYLCDGDHGQFADAKVTITGPIVAPAYTLTEILTPVAGWAGVTNLLDAIAGTNIETDAELRLRREDELHGQGTGPVESIRRAILAVADVTACIVFSNTTDAPDGDGLPAHSVEALARGGDDEAVRAAVFRNVAAGVATHGSNSGTVVDSQGIAHTVKFTRPTEIPIYVVINVTKDPDEYPADGDAQVKAAIAAFGARFATGKDAVASGIAAQAFKVAGVLDVSACFIGIAPAPVSSTTIAVAIRELATFDTSRITVNSVNGTP